MQRLRELVQRAALIGFDYDLTLARTDLPSPNGLTVEKAYALAIDEICGVQEGTNLLQAIGGLRNRAPAELAEDVLRKDPFLIVPARIYYAKHRCQLNGLVPAGKGVDLVCAIARGDDLGFLSELIVRAKLSRLNCECGVHQSGVWPQPCEGVPAFFKAHGNRPRGVISSGHDMFIETTFKLWGVQFPELIVTDDDMRGLNLPVERKTKPSPYLVEILLAKAKLFGRSYSRSSILFIGDDCAKDGQLAAHAGIGFAWYNPEGLLGNQRDGVVEFRHFDELTRALAG